MQVRLIAMRSIRENYGAHAWNGKGECPQYWKCKGGDEVLVATLDLQEVVAMGSAGIEKLMKDAMPYIDTRDNMYELDVRDYGLFYGDEKTPTEQEYEDFKKMGYNDSYTMTTLEEIRNWYDKHNQKVA